MKKNRKGLILGIIIVSVVIVRGLFVFMHAKDEIEASEIPAEIEEIIQVETIDINADEETADEETIDENNTVETDKTENNIDLEGLVVAEPDDTVFYMSEELHNYYCSDGRIDITERKVYEYDSDGRQTACTIYRGYDDYVAVQVEYKYDEDGNQIGKDWYNGDGSPNGWGEYECDNDGNRIKEKAYNSSGTLIYWDEYEYDSHGMMTKMIRYNDDGSGSIYNWVEYKYDEAGNQTKEVTYDDGGNLLDCWEYEYDTDENLIKQTYYNDDGSIYYWYEYKYDNNGNQIERTMHYETTDATIETVKCECDDKGNQLKVTYCDKNGDIKSFVTHRYIGASQLSTVNRNSE